MTREEFEQLALECGYTDVSCSSFDLLTWNEADTFVKARLKLGCYCSCESKQCAIMYYYMLKQSRAPELTTNEIERKTIDYLVANNGYSF